MALLGKEVRMSRLVNPKSNKMMAITVDHAISRGIAPMTGIQDIQGAIDKIVAGRPGVVHWNCPWLILLGAYVMQGGLQKISVETSCKKHSSVLL